MKKITPDLFVRMAENLYDSLSGNEIDDIHYIALADSNASWQNASVSPNTTPAFLAYDIQKNIIAAKKISENDISRMIVAIPFTPGETYDMYDSTIDMQDKKFYISLEDQSGAITVWKCLFNNGGLPATVAPTYATTSEIEKYQTTSDGYIWKFMYRVSAFTASKFKSTKYIPIEENANVKNAAKSGSIDVITVEEAGTGYNSYAYGTFKQAQVGGDPLIYSLSTSNNQNIIQLNLSNAYGEFIIDPNRPVLIGTETHVVSPGGLTTGDNYINFEIQDTDSASYISLISSLDLNLPMITRVYQFADIDSMIDTLTNTVIFDNATAYGIIESTRYRYTPDLSANTDFYKNSSIYIRSGRGAGQLRTIAEYIVAGNERRVMLDKAFSVIPTITSRFEILPRIIVQGDGTGSDGTGQATAIPLIDNYSNSIIGIQVIDPGKDYTYASAMAIANTGFINVTTGEPISSNTAVLRPILPPKGGHGSNAYAELYSTAVGISKSFENTEGGKLQVDNDFAEILLMKSVQTANTVLTLSGSALTYQDDELIVQTDNKAKGYVSYRDGNDLRLTKIEGAFTVGSTITTVRGASEITSTIVSVDRTNVVLNGLTRFSVEIQSTGFDGYGFRNDDVVRQGAADEENANASGIVFSANSSMITITNSKGVWNVSDDISGTVANIINVNNGAIAKITGKVDSDIVLGSGTILHAETISPITRNASQNESIRLVIATDDIDQ